MIANSGKKPVKAFVSYSHLDKGYRAKIEKALVLLSREGEIEIWHDGRMTAGVEFSEEIARQLHLADMILLLISPDFLASDYCWKKELPVALQRHAARTARVVPIILRPCPWIQTEFARLVVLPTDGKPLSQWDEDDGLLDITLGLGRAINELRGTSV